MKKLNNVEKYIYKFLIKLHSNNFYVAFDYLRNKYKLERNYIVSIIQECISSEYIDGMSSSNSIHNSKYIELSEYIYVTRKGYSFIRQYRLNVFNFFWIPFKNLVIILITAIITAVVTNYFNMQK